MIISDVTDALRLLWKQGNRRLAIYGAIGFGAMMALLYWQGERVMNRLDGSVTPEDLAHQTDTIASSTQDIATQIDARLDSFGVAMKGYMATERKLAVDTTLKPLVKMMFAMSRQIEDLQTVQRTTQSQVRQLPAAYEAGLRAIIDEKPPSRTDEMLEELLRAQDEQKAFNAQMDSLLRAKRKNNKVGL